MHDAAGPEPMDRLPAIDYGRHPDYDLEPDPGLRDHALEVLAPLVRMMTEREAYRTSRFGFRYGGEGELAARLIRDGGLQFQISPAVFAELERLTRPALARIAERVDGLRACGRAPTYAERREAIDKQACLDAWMAMDRVLEDTGALELTRGYFRTHRIKMESIAALVSRPEDGASDPPMTERPCTGMHIDSSGRCILKIVLYLSDVGPGDGPFGFVPTSHRWDPSGQDRIYRRAFDKSPFTSRSPGKRQIFISLPRAMQVKAEFGADLLPDWPQTRMLVERERVMLGPAGTMALFDPDAVHRGGHAQTGERRVLLVTLQGNYGDA